MQSGRRRSIGGRFGVALGSAVLALAACDATASHAPTVPPTSPPAQLLWPAPADAMGLTVEAGLVPETVEHLAFHVHAHLDVFLDGAPVIVPAGIGINIANPGVKEFDDGPGGTKAYGGIEGCAQPCISPLHTHEQGGIIHTESATALPNTLGQLFVEWDVALSATCVGTYCAPEKAVAFYLNGAPFTGDPTTILLEDRLEVAIVIGSPPAIIPSTADFSRA